MVVLPAAIIVFPAAIAASQASNAACVRSSQFGELVVLKLIDVLLSKIAGK
jgi:hypothetical protein